MTKVANNGEWQVLQKSDWKAMQEENAICSSLLPVIATVPRLKESPEMIVSPHINAIKKNVRNLFKSETVDSLRDLELCMHDQRG